MTRIENDYVIFMASTTEWLSTPTLASPRNNDDRDKYYFKNNNSHNNNNNNNNSHNSNNNNGEDGVGKGSGVDQIYSR